MADFLSNKAMDEKRSWNWIGSRSREIVDKTKGIVCFCDGGYRPGQGVGSAAWVVVAISACQKLGPISACDSDNLNINYYDDVFSIFPKLSKDVFYSVDKVAEGAIFLPACCSSFDAELRVVHELIQHVNHLVTRKRKLAKL